MRRIFVMFEEIYGSTWWVDREEEAQKVGSSSKWGKVSRSEGSRVASAAPHDQMPTKYLPAGGAFLLQVCTDHLAVKLRNGFTVVVS